MTGSFKTSLIAALCTVLVACATQPALTLPAPLSTTSNSEAATAVIGGPGAAEHAPAGLRQTATPKIPAQSSNISGLSVKTSEPDLKGEPISASLADIPLPAFINEAFGNLLKLNFRMDPTIGNKADLVTLRLPSPQPPLEFYRLARQVLRDYGISVTWDGSIVQIAPSAQSQGREPPLVISGRTLPSVPISHRPIFQLIELQSVRNRDVAGWLKMAFESPDLKIDEDINRNAIVLFGKPELVGQAVAAVKVLDRPFMRGRYSTRLEPTFVGADELSRRLIDVLNAEGYGVVNGTGNLAAQSSGTILLPVNSANVLLVFTANQDVLTHIVDWARTIDKPNQNASGNSLFYYQVRNTKAENLANTLRSLAQPAPAPAATPAVAGAAPAAAAAVPAAASFGAGRLTVDEPRNALIFQGEASEWQRMLLLIQQMDKAARQVMIEVTIAEVSIDNSEEFGVSWLAKDSHGKFDGTWTSGTLPAGANATSGLTYLLDVAGQNRAQLTALAKDSRVNILSTPRLLVMSGEEASIDVGTEVPTITSQTVANQQTSGDSNLLQSVQYRKTGILLTVKPTVYSDNRIDLDINQEVSDVLDIQANAAIASPSIFNRKVKTSLSLRDGGSIMLAGLISDQRTHSNSGVPGLKDIPVLGNLFKSRKDSKIKRELLLIIVPYIVGSDMQAEQITQAMNERLEYIDVPAPLVPPAPAPLPPQAPSQAPVPAQTVPLPEEAAPAPAENVPAVPAESVSPVPAEIPVPPAAEEIAPSADAASPGTLP